MPAEHTRSPSGSWSTARRSKRAQTQEGAQARAIRQQLADLAVRSAVGAGSERSRSVMLRSSTPTAPVPRAVHDTLWRFGAWQKGAAWRVHGSVVALHGFLSRRGRSRVPPFRRRTAKAMRREVRLSQCVEKEDPARARLLLREAAESGHRSGRVARARLPGSETAAADCAWDRLTQAAAAGAPSAQAVLGWM